MRTRVWGSTSPCLPHSSLCIYLFQLYFPCLYIPHHSSNDDGDEDHDYDDNTRNDYNNNNNNVKSRKNIATVDKLSCSLCSQRVGPDVKNKEFKTMLLEKISKN